MKAGKLRHKPETHLRPGRWPPAKSVTLDADVKFHWALTLKKLVADKAFHRVRTLGTVPAYGQAVWESLENRRNSALAAGEPLVGRGAVPFR